MTWTTVNLCRRLFLTMPVNCQANQKCSNFQRHSRFHCSPSQQMSWNRAFPLGFIFLGRYRKISQRCDRDHMRRSKAGNDPIIVQWSHVNAADKSDTAKSWQFDLHSGVELISWNCVPTVYARVSQQGKKVFSITKNASLQNLWLSLQDLRKSKRLYSACFSAKWKQRLSL